LHLGAGRAWCGTLAGAPVLLARTGEGRARAEQGAAALLERHPVSTLLVVGVSGGLSPSLSPGTVLVAREVRDGSARLPAPDPEWLDRALAHDGARAGTVVSSERILWTAASKLSAAAGLDRAGPAAVDLESAAYARVAARGGIGYLVLRAICDPVEEGLPFDLNGCRDGSGQISRLRVVRRILLRPTAMGGLWSLRKRVALGAERLADLVEVLLQKGGAG
jgi:adenosylhomocysteine nucleosidase